MASPFGNGTQVYFGNLRRAQWIKAPDSGLGADATGAFDATSFADGGAFVASGGGMHRDYSMSWSAAQLDEIQPLINYRAGLYGSGLVYWCDPYAAYFNVLPPHWADPFLSGDNWPSLTGAGNEPVISPAIPSYVRTNYITNPDFETGVTSWNLNGTGVVISQDTTVANTGTSSLKVVTNGGAADGAYFNPPAVADWIGKTVSVSAMVKGPVGASMLLVINTLTAGGLASTAFTATGNWQRVDVPGVVVPGTATSGPYAYVRAGVAVASYSFWVDNVQMERASSIGTLFSGNTPSTPYDAYAWTGLPNASNSTDTQLYNVATPTNGNPYWNATYTLSGAAGAVPDRSLVLLIPPTHQLSIGFSGTATGSAVVRVQPFNLDGSPAATQNLTLLSAAGTTRMNATFSGATYSAIKVYLTQTVTGSSSITLASGDAIYTSIGLTPVLTGSHNPGRGHSGMRFSKDVTIAYKFFDDTRVVATRLVSAATVLTEVGAWL
jgi:hypothetical protein